MKLAAEVSSRAEHGLLREATSSHFIHTNTARIRDSRQSNVQPLLSPLSFRPAQPPSLDPSPMKDSEVPSTWLDRLPARKKGRGNGAGEKKLRERKGLFLPSVTSGRATADYARLAPLPTPSSSGRCFTNCLYTTDVPILSQLPPALLSTSIKKKTLVRALHDTSGLRQRLQRRKLTCSSVLIFM